MKKLGLLVALALVAGSASAALILSDAEWANAYLMTDGGGPIDVNTGTGTLDGVDDGPSLGDVAITTTVEAKVDGGGFLYGWLYVMTDLAAPVAGDIYSVQIENVGTTYANVMLCAIVDGGTYVQNDGVLAVFDAAIGGSNPQLQVASYDLSGFSTIESVGLLIFAPQVGVGGGPTSTLAVPEPATFSMVALMGGGILFVRRNFRN